MLRLIRDQRVAFIAVGAINTVVGYAFFAAFLWTVGDRWGRPWSYLAALACAHVVSVLVAFVLYRFVVFRVRGHVLSDLWRFETVYLFGVGRQLRAAAVVGRDRWSASAFGAGPDRVRHLVDELGGPQALLVPPSVVA